VHLLPVFDKSMLPGMLDYSTISVVVIVEEGKASRKSVKRLEMKAEVKWYEGYARIAHLR